MKAYIPFHVGSGNRGCEGILRGTANILKCKYDELVILDRDEEEKILDEKLGLDDIGTLHVKNKRFILQKLLHKLGIMQNSYYIKPFNDFFSDISDDDVCFFTGGDLFCYEETVKENCILQKYLYNKGVKTILWGASIEEKFINNNVKEQLNKFSGIVCRETETLSTLKKYGIDNVMYCPDPAFTLKPQVCKLPDIFIDSKVIGINISNMVNGDCFDNNTIFMRNLKNLLDYIIKNTDYNILLIPHVTWTRQDDRKICTIVKNIYRSEKRIDILDVNDLGYLNIRYIISKCEMFIGGRTHSVISAYSTSVPTLALGYSIKARGIAKDLGLNAQLLFDTKLIEDDKELLRRYQYLENNKQYIRQHLNSVLPQYIENAYKAKDAIELYL